jgi:myosin heavy subunit
MLVALNPYCALDIYSTANIQQYNSLSSQATMATKASNTNVGVTSSTEAHIFGLANSAFSNLVRNQCSQTILIKYVLLIQPKFAMMTTTVMKFFFYYQQQW